MAILVTPETKVMCQGLTGRAATFHCGRMLSYGTQLVAGVVPGKGGRTHLDLPVYNTVAEAKEATGASASLVFVPPEHAAAAMIEGIEAELDLLVCVTERIPVLDMVRVRQALAGSKTKLVGPNSQGILAPGIGQLGVMTTVVTSADVNEDVVYALTREVFENLDEFKTQHPAFAVLTKEGMLQGLSAPLHPGAVKYYKEAGLMK